MQSLEHQRIVVTGGSRGLGLGIVEALVARGAQVTVVARTPGPLAEVKHRLGVATIAGDVADPAIAERVIREVAPGVLILNAGATPPMGPIHELTWEAFSRVWNTDVQSTLYWIQAALRQPLARGSRVVVTSSGAAVAGSPMSGGYAGAKRMQWMMASYANQVADELGLGVKFQALVPRQMIGEGGVGRAGAEAYAARKGISPETFLAGFGAPLPPRRLGDHVVTLLTDAAYEAGVAFGVKGDVGLQPLDG